MKILKKRIEIQVQLTFQMGVTGAKPLNKGIL
jgi:hypothetical protein